MSPTPDGSGMWNTSTCNNNNLFEWMYYAENVAKAQVGSLGRFHHKVWLP